MVCVSRGQARLGCVTTLQVIPAQQRETLIPSPSTHHGCFLFISRNMKQDVSTLNPIALKDISAVALKPQEDVHGRR